MNIKPDLVDIQLNNRVSNTLDEYKTENYWEPVRDSYYHIWNKIVKPNFIYILIIIIAIFFLINRYMKVKDKKKNGKLNVDKKKINNDNDFINIYNTEKNRLYEPNIN